MPESKEQFSADAKEREYQQVVPVDLTRLRKIRIVNVSGNTHIVGINEPVIRIRASGEGALSSNPHIELKNDGSLIEVKAVPGNGLVFSLSFDTADNYANDAEYKSDWSFPDFDGGEDDWNEGLSREERQRRREERHRHREERRRAGEERRRVQEEVRQARQQAKEAERQAGFFGGKFDFDADAFSNIAKGIGQSINQIFSSLGDLYIEIPSAVALEAKTVSGILEISDMQGFCEVKNTSGMMRLSRLRGGLELKGTSGKVFGQQLGGLVEAKVTSGYVKLTDCQLAGLDLSVKSGQVSIDTALVGSEGGEYRINTTSAQVRLSLPADVRAVIECRTLSGRIKLPDVERPVGMRNRPGQSQARFELNGGGRRVMINTLSGNIDLNLHDPARQFPEDWPTPPTPPTPPAPPSFVPPVPPVPSVTAEQPLYTPPPISWPTPSEMPTPTASADEQATAEATEPAVASKEPPPSVESDKRARQLDILQAIERGDLNVEDGLALISELDDML